MQAFQRAAKFLAAINEEKKKKRPNNELKAKQLARLKLTEVT